MKKIILVNLLLISLSTSAETMNLTCHAIKGDASPDKVFSLGLADNTAYVDMKNKNGDSSPDRFVKGQADWDYTEDGKVQMMDFTERTWEKQRMGISEWYEAVLYFPTDAATKDNPELALNGYGVGLFHHTQDGKNKLQTFYACKL